MKKLEDYLYYEEKDPDLKIYCGDCLEILPILPRVDLVVTSPPYNTLPDKHKPSGLHAERKSGVNKWIQKASTGYFDSMPEDRYQEWINNVISSIIGICDGVVWVNHKIRFRDGYGIHPLKFMDFPIFHEVIWDRGGSMALNCGRYAPSHEHIYGFGRPKYWNDSLNTLMSVWRIAPQREETHPCPYPKEIPFRLITSSCPDDGTVLDPFLGSGTTLVACKELNRNGIGIEISEKYCEIAKKRMKATCKPLFTDVSGAKKSSEINEKQSGTLFPAA